MLMDYEKKIILKEIDKLQRKHQAAWERYEVTGSRYSERTMKRSRILHDCLERGLDVGTYAQALETTNSKMMRKLVATEDAITKMRDVGWIQPALAAELIRTIREG